MGRVFAAVWGLRLPPTAAALFTGHAKVLRCPSAKHVRTVDVARARVDGIDVSLAVGRVNGNRCEPRLTWKEGGGTVSGG